MLTVVNEYLSDYNAASKNPMQLVLFLFALEHVSRICRIITSPGGRCSASLDLLFLLHPFCYIPLAPLLRHICSLNGTCMPSCCCPHTPLQRALIDLSVNLASVLCCRWPCTAGGPGRQRPAELDSFGSPHARLHCVPDTDLQNLWQGEQPQNDTWQDLSAALWPIVADPFLGDLLYIRTQHMAFCRVRVCSFVSDAKALSVFTPQRTQHHVAVVARPGAV